jgi:dipeptidyl aminopeptidase/acylaminoacyl peptidase
MAAMAGDSTYVSRRRLIVGLVAGGLTVACDAVWPAASPAPTTPLAGSPSPVVGGSPRVGQPVATSVQIVTAPSPLASSSPALAPPRAAQAALPPIVPGRVPSPSPGVVASPGSTPSASPGPSASAGPAASPQPLPIALGRPGLLAVQAGGRILLVDPERQQPTRTAAPGPDSSWPRWSPNGRGVLYVSGLGPAAELRLLGVPGGSVRRLTANARPESGAAWSPRGDRVAYALPASLGPDGGSDPAVPAEVWLLDVTSGDTRKVADGFDPSWSPDGRWIAYATNGQRDSSGPHDNGIRVVSADGADDRPLLAVSELPADLLLAYGLPFRPSTVRLRAPDWSPTGLQLAACADGHTGLTWTFDVRGQQLRPWSLVYEGAVGRARWSPDGAYLAVESRPATGVAIVTVIDIASRRETVLGGTSAGFQASAAAWAPNTRRLAVTTASLPARRDAPRQTTLRLFGADGADLGELLAEADLVDLDWGAAPT